MWLTSDSVVFVVSQHSGRGRHLRVHKARIHGVPSVEVPPRLPHLRLHRVKKPATAAERAVGFDPVPHRLLGRYGRQPAAHFCVAQVAWHVEIGRPHHRRVRYFAPQPGGYAPVVAGEEGALIY